MESNSYDEWLGRSMAEVPEPLRYPVFEYIFGADLTTVAAYAADQARRIVARVDPDVRADYEDVAQDVLIRLTDKLPAERIRHWKTVLIQELQWRALHLRRARLVAKRYPGRRIDYDDAVVHLQDTGIADTNERLVRREMIAAALAAITHQETCAVLSATFVLADDGSYFDVRTTGEVADLLGISQEKVKRLRAAGVKILRSILRDLLDTPDETDEEEK
ncbi:hypothetical protein ACIBCN_38450 [Nocardia sp. NPDC051052]|uniref:hypothetical protein n=1 Tax=Nocardia sp. NPDC051052 TaxID=3364322 RepID=UPI00378AFD8F